MYFLIKVFEGIPSQIHLSYSMMKVRTYRGIVDEILHFDALSEMDVDTFNCRHYIDGVLTIDEANNGCSL